jgi:hypothetical protein
MFKDIVEGNPIYILDIDPSTRVPEYYIGTLISRTPNTSSQGNFGTLMNPSADTNLLVELSNGIKKEFCGITSTSDYAVCGRYRISVSEGQLKPELQSIYDGVIKHINSMDSYKAIADRCESIMRDLGISNENYEARMKILESRYEAIVTSLNTLTELVSTRLTEPKST